ncbi:aminotransferase class V-fold PLP-dependent enzyme [Solirubrobacter sp. CPCC 204708]|uniref:Kynureninase n=1 Tax=Solirubrobacter deserti TaxID=2282478 RepID=A0ABT4RKH3_9ACTN|nr:aminotransferase class V-fold PLP-dependent enzyme [Solirubrobacter deserti]MBE2317333.1 aminotransferase class V-fold PLP-dependent enzyme [Solirubrobacter deserti]MDA0139062.1 aminotransferase class V-fold PLP-dependent enzyme [Solirubrobacter deserti]
MAVTRADALALDAKDPLAAFRERFVIEDEHRLYLDGNSLGRLPKGTRERLHRVIDEWGSELVGGWHDWIDAPTRTGDALAEVIGADPGTVLVADSVTVNLFKLVNAILETQPHLRKLATDQDNFPTDRYVLEGIARARGLELEIFDVDPLLGPQPSDVPEDALTVLSHVAYRSGALADMAAFPDTVIWDLSHSAGALPVDLRAIRYAVGCTYKYLNAGPGATGFLYARDPDALVTPIQGWFGQARQFEMERPYEPAPGITRFLAGTPPILVLAAVEEGARITAEAGIEAIREKSIAQTELLIALHDQWLQALGFTLGTPREPHLRGSHVSLRHEEAWPICKALIERADVIPDFRGPDSVRLGIAPLYTRFVDVYDALERLRDLVERGVHREIDVAVSRVT